MSMMEEGRDLQIILLGESRVGKTSLLRRFVHGTFKNTYQMTTIDYAKKAITIKDKMVQIVIWDTAGQEMYDSLVQGYYRQADGVLLVYDVQRADTFLKLSKWLTKLKSFNEEAQVLIAGNKIEDRRNKSVTISMVKTFAKAENLEHIEVSAKSGENIEILFHHLVWKILAAKGILPHVKDSLLTRLEECGEYLSPSSIISEELNSKNITPGTSDTVDAPSMKSPERVTTSNSPNTVNARSMKIPLRATPSLNTSSITHAQSMKSPARVIVTPATKSTVDTHSIKSPTCVGTSPNPSDTVDELSMKSPVLVATSANSSGNVYAPSMNSPVHVLASPDAPCAVVASSVPVPVHLASPLDVSSTVGVKSIKTTVPVIAFEESIQDAEKKKQSNTGNTMAGRSDKLHNVSHMHEQLSNDDLTPGDAECAIQFFDALGEYVSLPKSKDVIKLYEPKENIMNSEAIKSCC